MPLIKFPKLLLRKVLLAAVLISLAALAAFLIKENLDTKDPTSALPDITVKYNNIAIDKAYVIRASYSWNFLTTIENSPVLGPEDLPLAPFSAHSSNLMEISFSKAPKNIKVTRADGRTSKEFIEVISEQPGVFYTPRLSGYYLYKIEANWGVRGSILYYLAVQTRDD